MKGKQLHIGMVRVQCPNCKHEMDAHTTADYRTCAECGHTFDVTSEVIVDGEVRR